MAVTGGEAVSIPPCMSGSASGLQRRRTVAWPIGGGEAVLELYYYCVQLTGLLTKNQRDDIGGGERFNAGTEYKRAKSDRSHSTSEKM